MSSNPDEVLQHGLNPYYTGSYSMRPIILIRLRRMTLGLNPYYTGSYSMRCTLVEQLPTDI